MRTIVQRFRTLLADYAFLMNRYVTMSVLSAVVTGLAIVSATWTLSELLQYGAFVPSVTESHADQTALVLWLGISLILSVSSALLSYHATLAGFAVSTQLLHTLRLRIAQHLVHLPLGWFTPTHTSQATSVLNRGTINVLGLPNHQLTPLIRVFVVPITVTLGLLTLDWRIAAVCALALPAAAVLMLVAQKFGVQQDRQTRERDDHMSSRIVEFAEAQETLRGTRHTTIGADRLRDSFRAFRTAELAQLKKVVPVMTASHSITNLAFLGLMFAAFVLLLPSNPNMATVTSAIAAVVACHIALQPLSEAGTRSAAIRMALGQLDEIDALLAAKPLTVLSETELARCTRPDGEENIVVDDARRSATSETTGPLVQVAHVDAGYEHLPVLTDVSFTVAPGEFVAIVGRSGSGKSTLAKAIARHLDVTAGSITLGQHDVRTLNSSQLGTQVAYMAQESVVFSGTLRENISIAYAHATDDDVYRAIEGAGLFDLFASLPEGLQTLIGTGGRMLSGGEQQRIGIARALIASTPLLVLDEPTSALDVQTESAIMQTLLGLRNKHAIVLITHRLSTLAQADRILVMEDGQIKETGTHASLLAQESIYARFWQQRERTEGWRVAGRTLVED